MGVTKTYDNITNVYMDGGEGSDQLIVNSGVTADIYFDGGSSDDRVYLYGGGSGSIIKGGEDNDFIRGQAASGTKYYGDGGDDEFYSDSSNDAWIDM